MKYPSFREKGLSLLLTLFILFTSCKTDTTTENDKVDALISTTKETFAPDKRVAIFDLEVEKNPEGYLIKGVTNLPDALQSFREELESQKISYTDSIEVLPSATLEGKIQGVVTVSVANLRGNPSHSAEMVTQATLGTPLKVYQKERNWYRVQTPDHYLGWVDSGGLELMDKSVFGEWQASDKLIYTQTYGNAFAEADAASQVVSDLVFGNILQLVSEQAGFYEVNYPDGRKGFISKSEAAPYATWTSSLPLTKEALVATSKKMLGVPYLWGGTSAKGVDCSGFTKTVYFMNGMIIPRDASQQIHEGILIDDSKDFDKLVPGDLLFFGRKATDTSPERVIHVGMWIGNNEFIHSAGDVHISSMDKDSENFDEYNYNRYLRSKRILNETDEGLLYLTEKNIF
ncbi:MAG: NlpC/P60 family protein [Flavobacteriaceae bacterium]|uniref:C40 family peptidase n=1 Tax=Flagellimonas TaxID=444459 RepID=UPI003BA868AD|nr:NlpC/P60 family protein [Flavobacteriaceae bacterium]